MSALTGRTALVTGGGGGIGRATCLALARAGAAVVIQDIDSDRVEETGAALRAEGGVAHSLVCDVADESALRAGLVDLGPITILVNNAGVVGFNAPLDAIDRAAYDRLFNVHVWGAFAATRATLDGMRRAGGGRIINIASNRGQVGFERSSHYSAAKAALIGLAKSWAREFAADNILVNAVAPGVVRTPMTLSYGEQALIDEAQLNLLKRYAEPEEIAATVMFLVGPGGDYWTGQLLCPNGGDPIVGI